MPIEERNPNIDRLSAEFTDGADTNEFDNNDPLVQDKTGWDSSQFNQRPAGPLTDIGQGRSGQVSDPTQDYSQQKADDYSVRTSWPSGNEESPVDSGPHFNNEYEKDNPNRHDTVAGGGSEFTGSNEGLRDRNETEPSVGIGGDSRAIYPGNEENRRRNQQQGEWDQAGAGLVGTHDLGDDVDDIEDDMDDEAGINFIDEDDEEIEDEVRNDYDEELGQPPRNSF